MAKSRFALQLVRGKSHYFTGHLSAGVYINKNKVATLIDSGIDNDNAKGFDKVLKEMKVTVGAIINTHHHPDHCGGNAYFQRNYPKVKIFAAGFEKPFIENPFLVPFCFNGGATPVKELCDKHLKAQPSSVTHVIADYKDQSLDVEGDAFRIVPLPGHCHGMIGIITPDNVFYTGDSVFGDATFNKHGVLLYTDIESSLKSFDTIAELKVSDYVMYHGGLGEEKLATVAQKHKKRMLDTKARVLALIEANPGISGDALTQKVVAEYEVPEKHVSYVLARASVAAFVTQLAAEKSITLDGMMRPTARLQKVAQHLMPAGQKTDQLQKTPSADPAKVAGGGAADPQKLNGAAEKTSANLEKSAETSKSAPNDGAKSLSTNAARVQQALADKKITDVKVQELPSSTHTAADAAKTLGCEIAQIAKTIVLKLKGKMPMPIIVIASGSNKVNTSTISAKMSADLGDKVSVQSADKSYAEEQTGFPVGGVPPFGHTRSHITFIDADLLKFKEVWAAAGTPNAVMKLTLDQLQAASNGTVMKVT